MKKHLLLYACVLGMSASAFGSTCFSGGTLASYISAGSCSFSGSGQTYTLDNFTFVAVGLLAGTANASDIVVTESIAPGGPTVTFTPDHNLDTSGLLSSLTYLFGFDIASGSPDLPFASVNLGEQSLLTGGLLSVGAVAEQDCYGGALPVGILSLGNGGLACLGGGVSVGAKLALSPGVGANANANIQFTGYSTSVDVLKEIDLTSAIGGSASVASITQSFTTSTVPEPASFFMAGCGLILITLIRPRRWKKGTQK